ncbi:MAG: N-acetylneuraminate synthase family protein [Hadesarchaea archaeon]|nr:N-acetylneuraminate synthase family protein [Hadesarchaea archaeon]
MVKIIAELCRNHNGNLNILKEMIWKVADAGATYAKIQSMLPEELTFRERFEEGKIENGQQIVIKRSYGPELESIKKTHLSNETHYWFIDECKVAGIKPLTTVYSRSRIPFLASLPWPDKHIKVASWDCGSHPMIKELENFDHLFVSTGMTENHEVEETARILSGHSFTFLHCVGIYPTPLEKINLTRINYLKTLASEVGFSDHTAAAKDGIKASIAALMFDVGVIERHFTILDRSRTKDGSVSIDFEQLKQLVEFSKMRKSEVEDYVAKNVPEFQNMIGGEHPRPSHKELITKDYQKGRFASKVNGDWVFNWEDKKVF